MTLTNNHDKMCALFGDLGSMSKRTKKELAKEIRSFRMPSFKKRLSFYLKIVNSKTYLKLKVNDLKNNYIFYEFGIIDRESETFSFNIESMEVAVEVL